MALFDLSEQHALDAYGRPLPPLGAGAACYGCAMKTPDRWCLDCPRLQAERARRAGIRDQLASDNPQVRPRRPWWRRLTRKDQKS
jgi:hypothetical protein